MSGMFGPSRRRHGRPVAASALQEIEVVSMDDGEAESEYVLERGVAAHPSASSSSSSVPHRPHLVATSPLSLADSSDSTTSTSGGCCGWRRPPSSQDEANGRLESLLAMATKERPARSSPPGSRRERRDRAPICPTPVSHAARAALLAATSGVRPIRPDRRGPPVNDHDRTKMVDWYYEMSDFLRIERGTASRSLTLLDRFMSSGAVDGGGDGRRRAPYSRRDVPGVVAAARLDRDEYQLAALTALFLGIKLHERLNIQPGHVAYLSRGRYGPDEVVEMEGVMLAALGWRVSGADKVDFVEALVGLLLPSGDGGEIVRDGSSDDVMMVDGDDPASSVADLSHLQIQLSDFDASFSSQRPSLVALAAVMNAFELKRDALSDLQARGFLEGLRTVTDALCLAPGDRGEVASAVDRLRLLVEPPSTSAPSSPPGGDSALDAALETMDGFDMGDFLCCGSAGDDRPSAPSVVEASSSSSSLGSSRKAAARGESGPSPTSAIASMLFGASSRQ